MVKQTTQHQERWWRGTEDSDAKMINPLFSRPGETEEVPRWKIPEGEMEAQTAYEIVNEEMMLDGNARQNMATFVTTWMDEWADKLYAQAYDKNMIDKNEYPQTAAIEQRCIHMVANLWNSPEPMTTMGASAIGSSEACMLGGIALKKRWQALRKAAGKTIATPNIVFSTAVQVVWEKFANYWDVEARYVPITKEHPNIDPSKLKDYVDENTIGVVGILGVTYTGGYEDIQGICAALDAIEKETGLDIPVHVDAASGGFIAPFLEPELVWDFRLERVYSISASGHKFGLVYPGMGWVCWRVKENVPDEMIFWVDYLGGNIPDLSINFSRPAAQILLQYYNFLHLGYTAAEHMPLITWMVKPGFTDKWDAYDLSNKLRERGWQIPAYPLTADAQDVVVLRIVFRNGTSRDLADLMMSDIKRIVKEFETLPIALPRDYHTTTTYDHN